MKEYIEKEDAINLLWLFADESCASVVSDFEGIPAADVVEVLAEKHAYNKTRPYRHGGKAL